MPLPWLRLARFKVKRLPSRHDSILPAQPVDIIRAITDHLDAKSIILLALTCKSLYAALFDERLLHNLRTYQLEGDLGTYSLDPNASSRAEFLLMMLLLKDRLTPRNLFTASGLRYSLCSECNKLYTFKPEIFGTRQLSYCTSDCRDGSSTYRNRYRSCYRRSADEPRVLENYGTMLDRQLGPRVSYPGDSFPISRFYWDRPTNGQGWLQKLRADLTNRISTYFPGLLINIHRRASIINGEIHVLCIYVFRNNPALDYYRDETGEWLAQVLSRRAFPICTHMSTADDHYSGLAWGPRFQKEMQVQCLFPLISTRNNDISTAVYATNPIRGLESLRTPFSRHSPARLPADCHNVRGSCKKCATDSDVSVRLREQDGAVQREIVIRAYHAISSFDKIPDMSSVKWLPSATHMAHLFGKWRRWKAGSVRKCWMAVPHEGPDIEVAYADGD